MKHTRFLNAGFSLLALLFTSQLVLAGTQDPPVPQDARAMGAKLREADRDRDGRLSRTEAAGLPVLAKHFDRIDGDRDGYLTREEFRTAGYKLRRFRDEHFGELRDLESESHQARIRILQQADACIKAAATPEAYRQCERQEQDARQSLRESMKSRREDLVAATRP